MACQKRIAVAVIEPKEPGKAQGAYFPEVYRCWKTYTTAGLDVQLTSESGSVTWNPESLAPGGALGANCEELCAFKDREHPFHAFVAGIKSAKELSATDFVAVFSAGGAGACMECCESCPTVYKLIKDVDDQGGLFSFSYQDLV